LVEAFSDNRSVILGKKFGDSPKGSISSHNLTEEEEVEKEHEKKVRFEVLS